MALIIDKKVMEQFVLPVVLETRQWVIQGDVAWLVDWMTTDKPGQCFYIHYLIKIHLSTGKPFANDEGNHLASLSCRDGVMWMTETLEQNSVQPHGKVSGNCRTLSFEFWTLFLTSKSRVRSFFLRNNRSRASQNLIV